jgi:hypothetical protein
VRLAEFAWRSPPPTSVDERLFVLDDGSAWLVVMSPVRAEAAIGTFRADVPADDLAILTAAGPGPTVFDVAPPGATGEAALRAVAERTAETAHASPVAAALFSAAAIVRPGSAPIVSLVVTADGSRPVEFELAADRLTVLFGAGAQPLGWQAVPPPGMGFMTPDVDLLGGVGMRASVAPGELGAIALNVGLPPEATTITIEVAGMLHAVVDDAPVQGPFRVRTARAQVHRQDR